MTLTNVVGHLYPYGAQLMAGAVAADSVIDWSTATGNIYIALVGPYNNLPFVQDKTGATQKYWSDVIHYDIYNQATPAFPLAFNGNAPYATGGGGGGAALVTLAPYTDSVTASPSIYIVLTASHASIQAPVNTSGAPYGGTLNGIMLTNMTYSAMQGAIIYKKTGGANTTWPLIGYLDYSGGSVNSLTVDDAVYNKSGQKVVKVTSGTGFVAGQTVTLFDTGGGTPQSENLIIGAGGVSGNLLTMATNLNNSYTAAHGGFCIQANNANSDKFTASFAAAGMFALLLN
jgi:hypothetical protein